MLALAFIAGAIWAAWRRPDWVSVTLIVSLALCIYIGDNASKEALPIILSLAETTMALALLFGCIESVNRNDRSWTAKARRAQVIGLIGAGKIILWLAYASNKNFIEWNTAAAMINAALVLQICAAGGLSDGFTARIIDYRRRVWHNLLCRLGHRKAT